MILFKFSFIQLVKLSNSDYSEKYQPIDRGGSVDTDFRLMKAFKKEH